MPVVRPFTGLLYDPAAGPLEDLTSPPYDVITPADQDRLYRASPYNVVRLILGRDEPGDGAGSSKYTRARSLLRTWRREGVLRPTRLPAVYPYELEFQWKGERHRLRGLIAAVSLEPWGGSIIPHERTLAAPIRDRLTLLQEVRANLSPVYAVLPSSPPGLADLLADAMAEPPAEVDHDEAGTTHRLWALPSTPEEIEPIFHGRELMIADGHHRYTVSLAHRDRMRAEVGPGPWDEMMMFLVDAPAEDPPVLPIHRVLRPAAPLGLDGPPWSGAHATVVRDMAEILASVHDADLTCGLVTMRDGTPSHEVMRLEGLRPTVCALHDRILHGVDPAELRYVPDPVAAEQAVVSGGAAAAFLLPPTDVAQVWRVVRERRRLPEKSTYFWPKPRTGMVIRPFDAA